jgi:RNA polymerase sigma-70 factor (ECF subfamily)
MVNTNHFLSNIVPLREKLLATAIRLMQNEEDAEDAVQEALLRLWKMQRELDKVINPGAFAMQTVKNICIDRLRIRKEQTNVDDFLLENNSDTPYLYVEQKDTVAIVQKIIDHLPELQKIIIRMRDIEGYDLQEIADIVQTQVSAVAMNLSRARKKVREQLFKIMHHGIH